MILQLLWRLNLNNLARAVTLQYTDINLSGCAPKQVGRGRFLVAFILTQLLTKFTAQFILGIIHDHIRRETIMLEE